MSSLHPPIRQFQKAVRSLLQVERNPALSAFFPRHVLESPNHFGVLFIDFLQSINAFLVLGSLKL